ncbi:hypothetical protein L1049_020190 [Liquidambar formosana]|uniref:Uncharacterized protein n=1 Tax=Liquidambar formosana TaxID=63359 RepID=A0AAP0S847_LIQFO
MCSHFPGEGCHATEVVKQALEVNQISESISCEGIQSDRSKLDERLDNAKDAVENSCGSAIPDVPAPEKLLSVPEGLSHLPNDWLIESTPDKEVQVEGEGNGAGIEIISGKKRSFMESNLTLQSLNSVESFGKHQFERTVESVPDDDDLLSSILVGRRSSILKMKPTPPLSEVVSMKRPRTAPRVSASKRKVLMDDTMVLHGDTIRQQLTNSEDIRRVRKKAPCTRPEIWMIQKQFLEDEVFSEPISTGMSTELICLHNQRFDLSRIRVSQNDENIALSEVAKDVELSVRPNDTNESEIEGNAEPFVVTNNGEAQPAETLVRTEDQQGEDNALGFHNNNNDAQVQMKATTAISST